MRIARRLVLASIVGLACTAASGQQADTTPLRIVVPFAAGSTIDAIARTVAQKLQETGTPTVIVDNRPGAAGIIGTAAVAKAKPDGKTILLQAKGLSTMPAIRADLPYDTLKDLAPLTLVGYAPYAWIVPADSPHNTLKDLLDWSRATRNPIMLGTSGTGSQSQFVAVQIEKAEKVSFTQVPFKGQADILLAVAGSQIQLAMMNQPSAIKQYKDKRIKILATMTDRRTPATPEIPTLAEAGIPSIREAAWYGLLAPASTPAPVLDKLSRDLVAVLNSPDVKARLTDLGLDVAASGPQRFAEAMRAEIANYTRIAREENIKAE
jgi:tripartite-type tricarboxylate transporter receptor subunit TctC